jgi:hypothetical protein
MVCSLTGIFRVAVSQIGGHGQHLIDLVFQQIIYPAGQIFHDGVGIMSLSVLMQALNGLHG